MRRARLIGRDGVPVKRVEAATMRGLWVKVSEELVSGMLPGDIIEIEADDVECDHSSGRARETAPAAADS